VDKGISLKDVRKELELKGNYQRKSE